MRADLAVKDLLSGDLRVQRAALGVVGVVAERRADSSIPVLVALQAALASDEPKEPEPPKPLSFLPPVRVDALRVEQMRIDVRDEVAWSGQPWRIDVDVRGDDLDTRTAADGWRCARPGGSCSTRCASRPRSRRGPTTSCSTRGCTSAA